MTTLTDILAAHGTSPDTVSLTGPATRLRAELERWASEREDRARRAALVHAAALVARQATDDEGDHWRRLALAIRDEADGKCVANVEPVRPGEGPSDREDCARIEAWRACSARWEERIAVRMDRRVARFDRRWRSLPGSMPGVAASPEHVAEARRLGWRE